MGEPVFCELMAHFDAIAIRSALNMHFGYGQERVSKFSDGAAALSSVDALEI